jgi:CO/xanthine dehydrogenase FAD-binding subunit
MKWSSVHEFLRPSTLDEAHVLAENENTSLLAGGSYMLADRAEDVYRLVYVSPLLGSQITQKSDKLNLEAGVTVQQMVDELASGEYAQLAFAARESSSSRNLRSQRTIGGELVRRRIDSDLSVALEALQPVVSTTTQKAGIQPFAEWNGIGIITSIGLSAKAAATLRVERFSLLPHAPAFLIVAACETDSGVSVAMGGRAREIGSWSAVEINDTAADNIIGDARALLGNDHTGSIEYKSKLLRTALHRLGGLS